MVGEQLTSDSTSMYTVGGALMKGDLEDATRSERGVRRGGYYNQPLERKKRRKKEKKRLPEGTSLSLVLSAGHGQDIIITNKPEKGSQ